MGGKVLIKAKKKIRYLSFVFSDILLQDEDATWGKKESSSPPQQATNALSIVYRKARPNHRERCVSANVYVEFFSW